MACQTLPITPLPPSPVLFLPPSTPALSCLNWGNPVWLPYSLTSPGSHCTRVQNALLFGLPLLSAPNLYAFKRCHQPLLFTKPFPGGPLYFIAPSSSSLIAGRLEVWDLCIMDVGFQIFYDLNLPGRQHPPPSGKWEPWQHAECLWQAWVQVPGDMEVNKTESILTSWSWHPGGGTTCCQTLRGGGGVVIEVPWE